MKRVYIDWSEQEVLSFSDQYNSFDLYADVPDEVLAEWQRAEKAYADFQNALYDVYLEAKSVRKLQQEATQLEAAFNTAVPADE